MSEAAEPEREDPLDLQATDPQATVIGSLPNEMFRLRLDDGREVDAHAAKNLRMAYVRLLTGDVVAIDLSPFDPNKARIKKLLKQTQTQQQPKHTSSTEPNPTRER